ncbi:hypothetical protein GUG52_00405, partial [Xanthomonas citri pv. citri]|nr:hypothetical protein [Xanthomonas citri pv. citri]
ANLYLKADLAKKAGMQALSLNAGLLTGYQRDRREDLYVIPVAFESAMDARKNNLGVENTFVCSPDMMVNYDLLGSDLYFGS